MTDGHIDWLPVCLPSWLTGWLLRLSPAMWWDHHHWQAQQKTDGKRLSACACVYVCACVGVCIRVWWLHSCINTVLCGWVSRPSLTIILSHLCLSHSQAHKHRKSKHSQCTHTKCGLGGEVVLRRSELRVRMERDKRGTDNTCVGDIMLRFECLKWLFLLTSPAILKRNASSKLLINYSTFHSHIIVIHFPKLTPLARFWAWGME